MKITNKSFFTVLSLSFLLGLSACSGMTHREKSTAIGASVGAVAGAVVTGGVVGTGVGAAIGGVIGNQVGKDKK